MNELKIIQLIPFYPPYVGGMEKQALLLVKELLRNNIEVEVIAPGINKSKIVKGENISRFRRSVCAKAKSKLVTLRYITYVFLKLSLNLIEGEKVIIHGYGHGADKLVVYLLHKIFRVKYIVKVPTSFNEEFLKVFRTRLKSHLFFRYQDKVLRNATAVVVQDRETASKLRELGYDISRIHIIRNGVEVPRLLEKRNYRRLHERSPILLFVGRIVEEKGIFVLLDAFKEITQSLRGSMLWIVGDGSDLERCKTYSEKMDTRNVIFWGRQTDVTNFYLDADIFVFPSFREGLPNVILEAMSYQMPIVTTNVGIIPQVIRNKKEGLLVSPRDKKALVEAVKELVESPTLGKFLAQGARTRVEQDFSIKKNCEQHLRLYSEVLDGAAMR